MNQMIVRQVEDFTRDLRRTLKKGKGIKMEVKSECKKGIQRILEGIRQAEEL